jgi:hypothetical protein
MFENFRGPNALAASVTALALPRKSIHMLRFRVPQVRCLNLELRSSL